MGSAELLSESENVRIHFVSNPDNVGILKNWKASLKLSITVLDIRSEKEKTIRTPKLL